MQTIAAQENGHGRRGSAKVAKGRPEDPTALRQGSREGGDRVPPPAVQKEQEDHGMELQRVEGVETPSKDTWQLRYDIGTPPGRYIASKEDVMDTTGTRKRPASKSLAKSTPPPATRWTTGTGERTGGETMARLEWEAAPPRRILFDVDEDANDGMQQWSAVELAPGVARHKGRSVCWICPRYSSPNVL